MLGHHRHASDADGAMMVAIVVFAMDPSSPHQTIKTCQSWSPSDKILWIRVYFIFGKQVDPYAFKSLRCCYYHASNSWLASPCSLDKRLNFSLAVRPHL